MGTQKLERNTLYPAVTELMAMVEELEERNARLVEKVPVDKMVKFHFEEVSIVSAHEVSPLFTHSHVTGF